MHVSVPAGKELMTQNPVPIEILSSDDSDSELGDVVALPSPPAHLRRRSNRARPIPVIGSDNDDEEDGVEEEDEDDSWDDEDEELVGRLEAEAARRQSLMMEPGPAHKRIKRKRSDESSTSASSAPLTKAPVKKARFDIVIQAGSNEAGSSRQTAVDAPPVSAPATANTTEHPPTAETYNAQIIEILPDICPDYAMREVLTAAGPANHGVENVIAKALEEGYPKASDTQKKKEPEVRLEPGQEEGYRGQTFRAIRRRGYVYQLKCTEALEQAYPTIPVSQ